MFGKEPSPERKRLERLQEASLARLETLRAQTVPTLALYRSRHLQRLTREQLNLKNIREAIKEQITEEDNH